MDKPQARSRQVGLTRGKAILIAALSVLLVIVLYIQFGPSGEGDASPPADDFRPAAATARSRTVATAVAAPATTNAVATGDANAAVAINQTRWRTPDLATVVAFDPFAVPETFPQSAQPSAAGGDASGTGSGDPDAAAEQLSNAIEQLRSELQDLQERGVHVILKQRDHYVAMIGDRTVRVGDEINGFIVTAIEPDHVRVEWKAEQ